MKVRINTINKVKSFVNEMVKVDAEIDLISGRYVIDAKSIMGVFSLDLTKDLEIVIRTEDQAEVEKFNTLVAPYVVNEE